MMPITLKPAKTLTPSVIPRFINNGLANKMLPQANALLEKSFAANKEAAYCGYESGTYTNIHCTTTKTVAPYKVIPMVGTS